MGVDILHLWTQAGPFAKGVVIVLAAMSLFSLTVALTKFIQISKSSTATRKFSPLFSRAIQEEQLEQAITLAEKNKASHVAAVLGGALSEVKPLIRDRATITSADINSAERAVERQMLIKLSEFKRGLPVLATVASTAPFVGLLGTTMGIVTSFQGMSQAGASGGLAAISAGIAEALITTAFGLIVAIPAVWFYNYLSGRLEYFNVEMDNSSSEMVDYFIKKTAA